MTRDGRAGDARGRMPSHPDYLKVDAEDTLHMDWPDEWRP